MPIIAGLIPHRGIQRTALGPIEIEHDQWIIWAAEEGRGELQVGYVGKHRDAPINWLRQPNGQPWPEPVKQAVRAKIAEQLGGGARQESQSPLRLPPDDELDDELDEALEEDLDEALEEDLD